MLSTVFHEHHFEAVGEAFRTRFMVHKAPTKARFSHVYNDKSSRIKTPQVALAHLGYVPFRFNDRCEEFD
jgi:hypothetical protein